MSIPTPTELERQERAAILSVIAELDGFEFAVLAVHLRGFAELARAFSTDPALELLVGHCVRYLDAWQSRRQTPCR